MALSNRNHEYRPMLAGIAILNPIVNKLGTLGLVAIDENQDRYIVSCYHVLCREGGGDFVDDEPIYQPLDNFPDKPVAHVDASRADKFLDCAAAKVVHEIKTSGDILEIGRISSPIDPVIGMRVLKSGIKTEVTEGQVTSINEDEVVIEIPSEFSSFYELSQGGDSGALWVERDSRAPIALHTRGNDTGQEQAFGVRIKTVLHRLRLSM